jgi:thymidylate synthase ThyX
MKAKIIADSISEAGKRITTFELEFPRFILPEFNTHRHFSRNAASSRAIPVKKMLEIVNNNPATPVHWGKNQPGMQAEEECNNLVVYFEPNFGTNKITREMAWEAAKKAAVFWAQKFDEAGYHKQIVNRIVEPFQMIRTVVTATEWNNFFYLRRHKDAQPEIKVLADLMWEAMNNSTPNELPIGVWHTPYVDWSDALGYTVPVDGDYENGYIQLTEQQALKISASCCAQVSYRLLDNSIEKAEKIYDMLVNSKPVHASPFEHCAKPMSVDWEDGVTHVDRDGYFWSGNFKRWIQYRQLIEDNVHN